MDVGVIGVGTMGRNHVRVYTELKDMMMFTFMMLTATQHGA
jgi:hypothetical protein